MVIIEKNTWATIMPEHLMLMSREASTPLLMTLWMKMTHDSLDEDESRWHVKLVWQALQAGCDISAAQLAVSGYRQQASVAQWAETATAI